MHPKSRRALAKFAIGILPNICASSVARGQDLEPRRWTLLPVGTNVFGVGYGYTSGDLAFDPVLRIEDVEFDLHTASLAFSRYFGLFGETARFDALVPFQSGQWKGLVDGEATSVRRDGMADPIFRFSYSFLGAPAIEPQDFAEYRQENPVSTALGAAVELKVPWGEYMDDKLINLGQNRFAIAPQVGLLHTHEDWSFELTAATFFYTQNDDFFGGNELDQDPLFALQTHVVKVFDNGLWLSCGAAYGWGGESSVNGENLDDDRRNLLYGAAFGSALFDNQSIRIGYVRANTLTDIGGDSHTFYVGWSIRF